MRIRIKGLPINQKINCIKAVRYAFDGNMGLKEAKDLVESVPVEADGTISVEGELLNPDALPAINKYIKTMRHYNTSLTDVSDAVFCMPNASAERIASPRPTISSLKAKIAVLEQANKDAKACINAISLKQSSNDSILRMANDKVESLRDENRDLREENAKIYTLREENQDLRDEINSLRYTVEQKRITATLTIGNQTVTIINAESFSVN